MLRRITRNGGVGVRSVRRWLVLSCVSRDDLKRWSVSPRPLTLFRPQPRRGPRARAKKSSKGRWLSARKIAVPVYDGEEKNKGGGERAEKRATQDGGPAVNEDARGNRGPRGPQK